GAQFEADDAIAWTGLGGQHHYRNARTAPDLPEQAVPVHTREHHVEDQEVIEFVVRSEQTPFAIRLEGDPETRSAQYVLQHGAKLRIVVHHQDIGHLQMRLSESGMVPTVNDTDVRL